MISNKDKKATINSIRLANYLRAMGNLYLVDRNRGNSLIATISCANNVSMKLWLGGGISTLTPKNSEGLVLEISDEKETYSHVLLSGDVPYECMPSILNTSIDFMHVPHHCSKMELDEMKKINGQGKCAIISTNRKKDGSINYDNEHHLELEKKFHKVVNTIDNLRGDEENLSVQIDYQNGTFVFR